MMTLIARFQVDGYEPRQVTGLDADWFGLMTFAKTFTAGIVGHATTLFMGAGSQEGAVTVQHGGLESDPGTWFGHIVPGTGTGGSPAGRGRPGSSTMIRART